MDRLDGRTALVTGSSGGIGSAIADRLARAGARVVVHGRSPERSEAVRDRIRATGGQAEMVLGDLDSDAAARSVTESVRSVAGPIDILVNNAGGFEVCPWADGDADRWLATYNETVASAVRVVRALVPDMRERGWGRIIQVSSVSATIAPPLFPDYAAAKAAMLNLTVSLAKDLAGTGVTVNTVSPGPVVTRTWERFALQIAEQNGWPADVEEVKARLLGGLLSNPTGRLGSPEDIAHAVGFLASPGAAYVNGVNLRVDGGLSAAVR